MGVSQFQETSKHGEHVHHLEIQKAFRCINFWEKQLDVECEELTTTSLIKPSQVRQDHLQRIYVD